jgi:hypothetical protein
MTKYGDLNGDSNVSAYDIGQDSITVQFADGACYLYTAQSVGLSNLNTMITLARAGRGLNGFISRVVKSRYDRKLT